MEVLKQMVLYIIKDIFIDQEVRDEMIKVNFRIICINKFQNNKITKHFITWFNFFIFISF